MVTRSYPQLAVSDSAVVDARRARLIAAGGEQHALITRALDFIEPLYARRALPSGESLLDHALEAALILSELKLDPSALCAALLYPALDMSADAAGRVREKFGAVICDLAIGVARMAQIDLLSSRSGAAAHKPQQQAAQLESLRKMLLAMVQDVRVVLIKLADHLQSLRFVVKADN
ncbi:MAG: HD domain-containing protein, partial [Pseudomonadota bacterium]